MQNFQGKSALDAEIRRGASPSRRKLCANAVNANCPDKCSLVFRSQSCARMVSNMGSGLPNEQEGSVNRIAPRYVFEKRIRISVQRVSENLVMEGWTRDIGEGGLSAFVARDLMVGEHVTLEIPLAPLRSLSIPAKIASRLGTHYGFQFIALSPEQRADIQSEVRNRPEINPYKRLAGGETRRDQYEADARVTAAKQETIQNTNSFADRARLLIKRGYTPKVAVELVLHEVEMEHPHNPRIMERARAEAEDFLKRVRRGLI